ncbi:MAG: hypothetical protein L3K06_03540 [Thermoplasmata archaeon]|nr:hypothetical protein [Thermoplasmata archaeon]
MRLPSWARFPRVAGLPDGPAFPSEGVDASRELRDQETQDVLRELDQLHEEIRGREAVAPPSDTSPVAVPETPMPVVAPTAVPPAAVAPAPHEEPEAPDLWETPSSYLEERLRVANAAARDIGRDFRAIDATWSRIVQTIGTLESEVARANEEMGFIRSGRPQGPIVASAAALAPAPSIRPTAGRAPLPRRVSPPVPAAPGRTGARSNARAVYAGFTADRYNRTIGDLKSRRRRLAGATLAVAGLISLALVTITALVNEPLPPLWLAVLPAIWMIPVPFFVLSFRGTQRVLRHNHLEVPPGEAT